MNPVVTPLHPLFVAQITGVDLSRPIHEATQRAIERAMDEYAVCVLPGQHLEDEELIAFSRLYGPLEVVPHIGRKPGAAGRERRVAYREIFDISNLDENGAICGEHDARSSLLKITQLWHTDLSFRQGSAKWSMLHAKVIPPAGGDTEYADTRAAYDAMPEAMKSGVVGSGISEYRKTIDCAFHPFAFSFRPRNCTSRFLEGLRSRPETLGI